MSPESHSAAPPHGSDRSDPYGGLGLGPATLAALLVANSALEPYYTAFLNLTGTVPADSGVLQLYGVAILTGIGFTMSLFIGTLAFDDDGLLMKIRLGVLVA
jgi:Na+/H+ antiporter NhaA